MTAQETLKTLIDNHGGPALFAEENKTRLQGMIADYFHDDRKMRKLLDLALKENIACRLLKVKDSDSAAIEIKNLKFYLQEECSLEAVAAAEVVDCFAFALGLGHFCSQRHHPVEPEMVYVQGGTFRIGDNAIEMSGAVTPHRVTVSDFHIGKYLVTQAQWKAVMGDNPSRFRGFRGDKLPVEQVSWDDAQEFIRRLNTQTGKQYRLPTEAEWEFAARGGNKSKGYRYSGSNTLDDVAWYKDNSGDRTHPVGATSPNELGIYDMSGNVWEWCNDWYGKDYYSHSPQTNPQGPSSGSFRVLRGGNWNGSASCCRVAYRDSNSPGFRNCNLGFRVAFSSK